MTQLELIGIRKSFGSVEALAPLDLTLPGSHIHGVLGENGAGKTTLIEIIAGVHQADGGRITVEGRRIPLGSPRAARAAGVGIVHQHFALVDALTVAENLALGADESVAAGHTARQLVARAKALAETYGIDIGDPSRRCRDVAVGTKARIEILRALSGHPRVMLLDEPTQVLAPAEIDDLFRNLRAMREAGLLVVLVTHRLEEALAVCDQVSVMRAGRLVTTVATADTSAWELARLMVGVDPAEVVRPLGRRPPPVDPDEPPALAVRDLTTPADDGRVALQGVTLTLAPGEIRGIAGVDGNGQDELAAALAGLLPRRGAVEVGGVVVPPEDVGAAQSVGLALLPSDRRREGLAATMAVWENALLTAPVLARFTPRGWLDLEAARGFATQLARDYRVRLTSVDQPMATLSGGNQQRILIGRTLASRPRVLLAVHPTRGLDIIATAQVHDTLGHIRGAGVAVLLFSTDLDELSALAEKVQVLFRGRVSAPLDPRDRSAIGALMAGVTA